jgi:hypothetical protein
MKTIYISSTFDDLKDHRAAVYRALQKMQYRVIAMEDYVAKDERTVKRCLGDVEKCDFYIGIFAKRYGYIPPVSDNPEGKSITELEYRKAREEKKHCLLFLLDPKANWPETATESDPGKVGLLDRLRKELEPQSPALFQTPSDLAENVMASVHIAEAEVSLVFLPPDLQSDSPSPEATGVANVEEELEQPSAPLVLDTSYLSEITAKIQAAINKAEATKVIRVSLGLGQSWWSTRLHLLAAMLADYTTVAQIAFTGQEWRYLGMCPPVDVRRALSSFFPEVEIAYRNSLPKPAGPVFNRLGEIGEIVANFVEAMEGSGGEINVKQWVEPHVLRNWRGFSDDSIGLTTHGSRQLLLREIVNHRSPFVALVRHGRLAHVLDRVALATRIAQNTLG